MLAEEVYLLGSMTCIEIDPLSASEDTLPLWKYSGHSDDWKKKCNISLQFPPCRGLFNPDGTKRLIARKKFFRKLHKKHHGEKEHILSFCGHQRSGPFWSSPRAPRSVQPQ